MFLPETQQSLWNSDMVVEVALRVEHVVLLLQYGGNQFLCSGLAISARDADDGGAQMDTVVVCQLL